MSKKKNYNKHLQKGRFYLHNDKRGGHPALLYKKRDDKNMYFIIIFTSSPGPKRIQLKYSIEPERINISFVHEMPSIVNRRDLSSKVLTGIKIHKDDKAIITVIKRKK